MVLRLQRYKYIYIYIYGNIHTHTHTCMYRYKVPYIPYNRYNNFKYNNICIICNTVLNKNSELDLPIKYFIF